MRYLFFVILTICIGGISPLCMGTPIVADYTAIPKITIPATQSDPLLTQSLSDLLNDQEKNDTNSLIPLNKKNQLVDNTNNTPTPQQSLGNQQISYGEEMAAQEQQPGEVPFLQLGFNFDAFQETNAFAEEESPQQFTQTNKHYSSLNLKNILKDTIKDNEILREFAESSIEVYQSYRSNAVQGNLQANTASTSFADDSYKSSRNFLDSSPLVVSSQQAPASQRSWGEQTFVDKVIAFCFSWKGLLTLIGLLIFNSILFKLV